ncbi:hypothetical protein GIB67_037929 [Kingdonia uniflora]|uniref:Uncharacterized protein n=1 Tax=Kingdonia uniflora TaxID=39325 RepID=A0A7J7LH14_9MAGN|nr:hypothetical protein GIB67_037929 [Kingdonia uniflora]
MLKVGQDYLHTLLIDTGRATDVLFQRAIEVLGLTDFVKASTTTITGFSGSKELATGIITLLVQADPVEINRKGDKIVKPYFNGIRSPKLKGIEGNSTGGAINHGGTGVLGHGKNAHGQTIRMGFELYPHVANAIIFMYSNKGFDIMELYACQVEECKFIFEAKTIQRMELLVLSTLKWRMRVVTPFTFMDYFFRIEYLEFKPFEVNAAVLISVIRKTNLDKYEPSFIKNVQKERFFKCLELIHELQRSAAVQSLPQNPIGVLDVSCLSYKSDELPTVSSANPSQAD